MNPVLIALFGVVALFVGFWASRGTPGAGKRWGLRLALVLVVVFLSSALAKDARASAVVGQYLVYFGIAGVVVYVLAAAMVGRGRS